VSGAEVDEGCSRLMKGQAKVDRRGKWNQPSQTSSSRGKHQISNWRFRLPMIIGPQHPPCPKFHKEQRQSRTQRSNMWITNKVVKFSSIFKNYLSSQLANPHPCFSSTFITFPTTFIKDSSFLLHKHPWKKSSYPFLSHMNNTIIIGR
jgi:hypothetical protein